MAKPTPQPLPPGGSQHDDPDSLPIMEVGRDERQQLYADAARYDMFTKLGDAIRTWAREKGFEEDVDTLLHLVGSVQNDSMDEAELVAWKLKMHDFIQTLFSLAQIGLITSELGELAERVRKPAPDDHIKQFHGTTAEVADTMIRLLHFNARNAHVNQRDNGSNIDLAFRAKMEFNESRPHKHGKKA